MLPQERLGTRQILGRVDAYRLHVGYAHAYAVAVLEPSQLFERLGQLESRGGNAVTRRSTSVRNAYIPICL